MSLALQPISFSVTSKLYAAVEKRAAARSVRVGEYARQLFEAAFNARVLGERGAESGDIELDRACRQVFLLADCEPEYIAETLAMPVGRVERILAAWRKIAAEGERPAAPAPAPTAAPAPAQRVGGYPVEQIRQMWADGASLKEIAAAIGKTEGALSMWMSKNRDICPKRVEKGNGRAAA